MDLIYILAGCAIFVAFGLYAVLLGEGVTMLIELLYAAGALLIAGYMVAALLRPDKF